jgi:hypothetical protein
VDYLHLEAVAKLLKWLEPISAIFSKCALKSLENQTDFDSAIPRFESWRPSQISELASDVDVSLVVSRAASRVRKAVRRSR